jgi:ElaA protein
MASFEPVGERVTMEWRLFGDLSGRELYELLRFRQNIFVVEQHSPYPDLDCLDQSAWHLVVRVAGALAGYLRLMPITGPPSLVRIGRVAVLSHQRRHGIGRAIMEEALLFCRKCYAGQPIALAAQLPLAPFYQSFGFSATSAPYDDFGVEHVEMALRLQS